MDLGDVRRGDDDVLGVSFHTNSVVGESPWDTGACTDAKELESVMASLPDDNYNKGRSDISQAIEHLQIFKLNI